MLAPLQGIAPAEAKVLIEKILPYKALRPYKARLACVKFTIGHNGSLQSGTR
jgi:hypothetical protein